MSPFYPHGHQAHTSDACLRTIGQARRWMTLNYFQGDNIRNKNSMIIAITGPIILISTIIHGSKKTSVYDMLLQCVSLLYQHHL